MVLILAPFISVLYSSRIRSLKVICFFVSVVSFLASVKREMTSCFFPFVLGFWSFFLIFLRDFSCATATMLGVFMLLRIITPSSGFPVCVSISGCVVVRWSDLARKDGFIVFSNFLFMRSTEFALLVCEKVSSFVEKQSIVAVFAAGAMEYRTY
jgi:hypothetical protein